MEDMQANQTTKKNKTWLIVLLVVVVGLLILDNMGRIPSLDELLDWGAVKEYTVMLWGSDNKKFGDDKASRAEYVSDVAKTVADYYEITNEMKMSIQYRDNNYTYLFTAVVDDDLIELSGGLDEKHYVFER